MFERYDPREGKRLSLLKADGSLAQVDGEIPLMPEEEVVKAYRIMVLARQFDEWTVSLNRQGRMPTYPPNKGQEANCVGALMAVRQEDWYVPAFREQGAMIARGVPLAQLYLYWYGNEAGSFYPPETYHMLPMAVPVGSQTLHAVGLAFAERYRGSDRIAITFLGDGATSEGDVHAALNFAGVWKAGVIFYVQNNQWAISTPQSLQTATPTLAEKAFAYGFEGVQVDGNDLLAVYAAVTMAARNAREGKGPALIEGFTYRLGAHTTADDPGRYREEKEVAAWVDKDPLLRLERFLVARKLLTRKEIERLKEESLSRVREAFEEAEAYQQPCMEDTFRYTFHTMPALLQKQLARRKER